MLNKTIGAFISVVLLVWGGQVLALEYQLQPKQIAPNTYLLQGKMQDFSRENGGNIMNTAFVVTSEGVVVFDTGPSRRYGEAMRNAIAQVTDQPVAHVFNSHQHPDHFLGNQAFADVDIWALPKTGEQIAQHGNAYAENMYRMVGDWMRATELQLPTKPLEQDLMQVGDHRFRFYPFTGHTGADLVMVDETTGVMFAADMVFFQRMLTTPHTPGIGTWAKELRELAAIPFKLMVPGHGPVVHDTRAVEQMLSYLDWLDRTLTESAAQGKSMHEVMQSKLPASLAAINLSREEFVRSVVHLYPDYEEAAF
ncbi:quinoprotein relay system zinc metallohydrolase 1 [Pontibacterium sp.]|uniref:quinoprotein relay system zinc metallohydrolase 1 n=1 Tax=Pontibacterium sp. TaxID=2036026 RepID=UPI003517E44C